MQRPPEQDGDPLERIGKPFGGLVNDIKRKYPHYTSDFVDAFKSFKCLVAFIFVYFATIAPCVTYGGLLSKKTGGWLGLSESILATAIGGVLFGFFSGQPLMIVGVTGPVLLFEQTIYNVRTCIIEPFLTLVLYLIRLSSQDLRSAFCVCAITCGNLKYGMGFYKPTAL